MQRHVLEQTNIKWVVMVMLAVWLIVMETEREGALWNGHLMVPLVHHLKLYHFRSRLENVKNYMNYTLNIMTPDHLL